MKKVTVENYKEDKYYPRVVRAVESILAKGDVVAPIDVFVQMDLLSKTDVESWRFGRIPYLEKVIRCSLGKTSRILRILRMHVHDLNMRPSQTAYVKWGKGRRLPLRFSKTGDLKIEEAYSRHFLSPCLRSKRSRPEAKSQDREPDKALVEDPRREVGVEDGLQDSGSARRGRNPSEEPSHSHPHESALSTSGTRISPR